MINTSDKMVSVFMLAYNHEKYIAEAIESVLMQKTDFDFDKLERYLKHYNLNTLINDFRVLYDANSKIVELTVENCGF